MIRISRMISVAILATAGLILSLGCASTTAKKNPGPHDHGIRYYRPKPYLFIQPTMNNSDEFVSISLQYLPDYSEEYSLHIRTGIGKNKTSVTLDGGWNLTKLDVDIDSKVPENIEAASKLVDSLGKLGLTSGNSQNPKGAEGAVVKATNVPLGYYEAVIDAGPDGVKRLYGWRYVGFLPYTQCPQVATGVECRDCTTNQMYGLVFEKGVMTFRTINDAAMRDTDREIVKKGTAPSLASPQTIDAVRKAIIQTFGKPEKYNYIIPDSDPQFAVIAKDPKTYAVTIPLPAANYKAIVGNNPTALQIDAIQKQVASDLKEPIEKAVNDKVVVEVTLIDKDKKMP